MTRRRLDRAAKGERQRTGNSRWGGRRHSAGRKAVHGGYGQLSSEEEERVQKLSKALGENLEGRLAPTDQVIVESLARSMVQRDRWARLMERGVPKAVENYRMFDKDVRSWMTILQKRFRWLEKGPRGDILEAWLKDMKEIVEERE